ncbi:iron-sulfur cluster assembly scaffold protein [Candidatus Curtissbacteria bacterium]|nr:iron-sulfur cluster assembly scaffold protein [Candidatus Curtissbacteria bacterium]
MDIYREEILEHWQNPQNYGVISHADLVVNQINPLCGDEVTFYFKISRVSHPRGVKAHPGGVPAKGKSAMIRDVSFTGSGCAISTASASILSEEIRGKSVESVGKLTGQDVLSLIGGPVAPARLKCAFLALEAIRKLKVEN